MSVFTVKLLAIASMFIDHLAVALFPRFLSPAVYHAMRGFGRMAFPLFAFLIVNGYQKTRDASRYLTRLTAFAFLSQVPFTFLFNTNPFPGGTGLEAAFAYPPVLSLALLAVAAGAWLLAVRRDGSVVWPVLALGLTALRVSFHGVHILGSRYDIFYTLALGLSCVALAGALLRPARDWRKLALWSAGLLAAVFFIRNVADFRAMGVALILSLWLARDAAVSQAAVIVIWSAAEYLLAGHGFVHFLFGALPAGVILLYNGQLGRPAKRAFYLFYPLHILVLGLIRVYYTLV